MLVNADYGDGIRFLARNPKRQRTAAWHRYETYKVATTVFDALKLGAMPKYAKHYLKHCFASRLQGVAEASLHTALGVAPFLHSGRLNQPGCPGIIARSPFRGGEQGEG